MHLVAYKEIQIILVLIVKYKRLLTFKKIRSQYLFLVKLTMCVFSVFKEEMKRLIQMQNQ